MSPGSSAGNCPPAKTKGTPSYKLTFRVLEGDYTRAASFWHDVYLTPAALPMAKRDLGKLGVTALEQLERPLPPGIRCRVKLALRRDDDGNEYNRVRTFDVVGIDPPEADAFAPQRPPSPAAPPPQAGEGNTPQAADGSAGGENDDFLTSALAFGSSAGCFETRRAG